MLNYVYDMGLGILILLPKQLRELESIYVFNPGYHGNADTTTGAKNRQGKIVTKFVIRCVCHTEGIKSWQIMKKMTHKNLKIVKKLVLVSDI